ncbi:MAG: hypothetical protein Q4P24_12460, partial [Rhodobacterales bacterium]|nr:hypothetical protein [Rhodobacterales bacterium]
FHDVPPTPENTPAAVGSSSVSISFILPYPASVVSVTLQYNHLNDNDLVGVGLGDMFTAPHLFDAPLAALTMTAHSLAGFKTPDLPTSEDGWQDFVAEAVAAIKAVEADASSLPPGATVDIMTGAAAQGLFINGVSADEIPDLKDLLPAFLRPDGDVEAREANQGETEGKAVTGRDLDDKLAPQPQDAQPEQASEVPDHDFDKDFENKINNPWKVDAGHQVVAGANKQLNEFHVASRWLDADVIAVKGDTVYLDAISQVNVMGIGDIVSGQVATLPSQAMNVAEIVTKSSHSGEAATGPAGLPSNSATVRLEASVTQINWAHQYNFTTDNDVAAITISGSNTYFGLGGNTEFNEAFLTQIGFNYDLIMVGGNLFDVTMLTQTNVLLDVNWIDGAETADVGDNLQYNLARIETTGVDTHVGMGAHFNEALDKFGSGAKEITDAVAHDALFAGTDLLRVLYIDGDFTTVNVVQQTNILGDVDQVRIMQSAVEGAAAAAANTNAAVSVVAGSNAQVNIATVRDLGLDSIVMTGGNSYSDALIYQAGLIDMDAMPDGVEMATGITALANEAVAFLSDDMLSTHVTAATHDAISATETYTDTAGQSDIMQTVLA